MRCVCPRAMQHPSDGIPCSRSCTSMLWSFSVSQGLHLHVSDQARGSNPKALRKYDFRLLTPSTVGTFHRRGLAGSGMPSSVTQKNGSLMACGKRCVLSLRPERCGNKAENEKSKEAEENEREESTANRIVDEHRRAGEEKKRAQSGVVRTRVMVTSDARPSTAPAHTLAGRSDVNPLSPGTPGYRMVWRTSENGHHDTLDCTSTGTPVLHLYLPNYHTDTRKEMDEVLDVEADRQDADTDRKNREIQIQEQLDVWNDGNRNCDVTGGNRPPDDVEDVITVETRSEQNHKMEEDDKDGERQRGSRNERIEKEENEQHGVRENSCDISQEPSEERSSVEEEGRSGKSDDTPQPTAAAHQHVLEERQKTAATKLKSGAAHVRNSETKMTRRLTLPAPALSFPGPPARTHSSPSPCVLPSFYGSSFGHRIRAPHTPERHGAKTRPTEIDFDKRAIKPATERPPSLEWRGSRHVSKMDSSGITGPRPKITSSEWWGSLSRKTKTTKTFVWGPRGPQETKSVCELHTRTNRWRGLD
ncbi:uncharacterized protein LOC117597849 [Pangasianodon hypophthalmus]|uniref:uncharacterized protein LOC117597849 n=1 Tax=Pangasianodon hypophthalmus TaxID=310915 RepID=UPI00230730BC|nr:uncharacterized protein LOC117597849 [Pangasianodon hypophthalmus]